MVVVELRLMRVPRWNGSKVLRVVALAAALTGPQCAQDTSRLSPSQEARLQQEGIVRRANNVLFHYTHEYESRAYSSRGYRSRSYGYGRAETREDRRASIVVTRQSVLIHKNEKIGIEITERSRRYDVHRRQRRVLIHAGTGRTGEVWSFEPPDGDAEGWTRAIRAVIQGGSGAASSGPDEDSSGTSP
jgi:hypothetical protein